MVFAGGLGGFAATIYGSLRGDRFAFPVYRVTGPHAGWRLVRCYLLWVAEGLITIVLNAGAGALASLLLWATFTSGQDFGAGKFTPGEFAAGFTIGLGGVGAILGLMRQRETGSRTTPPIPPSSPMNLAAAGSEFVLGFCPLFQPPALRGSTRRPSVHWWRRFH